MKNFWKQYRVLPFLLALLFVTSLAVVSVHAQTSVSGDEVCGQWDKSANGGKGAIKNPCTLSGIGTVTKNLLTLVISLGLPLLVVFITYRFVMAYFSAAQGNTAAYKDAIQKSVNAMVGFLFLVALFSGLMYVVLKFFGVKDNLLNIFNIISAAFIPHAYAQTSPVTAQGSPFNLLGVTNLYDFIFSVLRVIMRFFIYPALIVIWVWTGFAFVFAQGAPEALTKAKKFLVRAFVSTLVVFLLQTFLIAIQGTVKAILPGTATQTTTPVGTPDGRVAPAPGALGSSCITSSGAYGVITTTGDCVSGGSR